MFSAFQKYLDGPIGTVYEPPVAKIEIQEVSNIKSPKKSSELKYFSDQCSSDLRRKIYTKNFVKTGESSVAPISSSDPDNSKMALLTDTSIIERKYLVDQSQKEENAAPMASS